jgi:HAD superfamily hydrolase (TIGR01509 family)
VRANGLVIFDAFNTLVSACPGSKGTFLDGLHLAGLDASPAMLATLQAASQGLDHSTWSTSRQTYVERATETLRSVGREGMPPDSGLAPWVVPALEQLHQAPMIAMPGALDCLRELKAAGFVIAVCSNWGWDLRADLKGTGLLTETDFLVTSAQVGYRKPHPLIYQMTLEQAGFSTSEAVFIGDNLATDVRGPEKAGIRSVLLAQKAPETFSGERVRSLGDVSRLLLDQR